MPKKLKSSAPTSTDDPSWCIAKSVISERIAEQGGGPKSTRLREAITAAIVSGDLRAGDQLPPEPQIAEATGISLGMVRHALSQLALRGFLSRQHGRGTFVSADSDYFTERWHMRFLDRETGEVIRPTIALLERRPAEPNHFWTRALGSHDRYISIVRLGIFPNEQRFLSELVLPFSPYSRLLEIPASEIEQRGIRFILADSFQVPIVQSNILARSTEVYDFKADILGLESGSQVLQFDFIGEGFDKDPIFLLSAWLPELAYDLDLSPRQRST